jgi:hypothetical protein
MDIKQFTERNITHQLYGDYCKHLLKNPLFTSVSISEIKRKQCANDLSKVFPRMQVQSFFNDFKKLNLK